MKLTKRYDAAHLQVLVLDHSLIPESVDVIIGDFLYELQFKVGPKNDDEPVPMEMDNFDGPNDDTKKEGDDLDGKNGKKSEYGKGKELSKSNDGKSSGVKIGAPTQIWDRRFLMSMMDLENTMMVETGQQPSALVLATVP